MVSTKEILSWLGHSRIAIARLAGDNDGSSCANPSPSSQAESRPQSIDGSIPLTVCCINWTPSHFSRSQRRSPTTSHHADVTQTMHTKCNRHGTTRTLNSHWEMRAIRARALRTRVRTAAQIRILAVIIALLLNRLRYDE